MTEQNQHQTDEESELERVTQFFDAIKDIQPSMKIRTASGRSYTMGGVYGGSVAYPLFLHFDTSEQDEK